MEACNCLAAINDLGILQLNSSIFKTPKIELVTNKRYSIVVEPEIACITGLLRSLHYSLIYFYITEETKSRNTYNVYAGDIHILALAIGKQVDCNATFRGYEGAVVNAERGPPG